MDATDQQGALSLELLARTSPGEFVEAFLKGAGYDNPDEYEQNASGSRSTAATLESLTGGWRRRDSSHNVEGITVKAVVREGGGEGEGESVYRVYAVIKDGVEFAHFCCSGYYASEYGTDWDDSYTTVYPRQVVVTQYFTSKE